MNADIDCALASAYMYIAAQSLGLAAHLYRSPISGINENLKGELDIPEAYQAILVMKMANIDSDVDGVSSASARKDLKEFVSYK